MTSRLAALAALGLLAGCAAVVQQKEDMLAAAGFVYKPADTPQKSASLAALPPHRFSQQSHAGQTVWVYADPTICHCLYTGNEAAYDRYKQEVFAQRIADEQQATASMNENAAMQAQLDWGLWGGGWGPYPW